MKIISKIILGLVVALLITWLVPWTYDFLTYNPQKSPFTLYSTDLEQFVYTDYVPGKGMIRLDEAGNAYGEKEFDEVLPQFYARQLVADERFPETIGGVFVTPREVQMQNFAFRNIPSSLNKPEIGLYYLLESMSGRVDLQLPSDVFRINNRGIEFIDANSNVVDREKSDKFSEVMRRKEFHFPARQIVGNPTTRKDYDEGYLIEDNAGKLFQLKMVKGRPFVKSIKLPEGLNIKYLFITEFRGKKSLGFISDMEDNFYVITAGSCEIKRVDIPAFNPDREVITIFGNLLDWTIQITSAEKEVFYAVDAESYKLIRSFQHPENEVSFAEKWRSLLMPLRLTFTSQYDKWVTPRIND